jgi:hypothetical protein
MHRLLALPLLLLSTAAFGQEVPDDAVRDLWCGIAFTIVSEDAPGDVTPEQQAVIDRFAEGGRQLTDRAKAIYLESGYTEQSLNAHLDTLQPEVATQVDSTEVPAPYSFEECSALLPS